MDLSAESNAFSLCVHESYFFEASGLAGAGLDVTEGKKAAANT